MGAGVVCLKKNVIQVKMEIGVRRDLVPADLVNAYDACFQADVTRMHLVNRRGEAVIASRVPALIPR